MLLALLATGSLISSNNVSIRGVNQTRAGPPDPRRPGPSLKFRGRPIDTLGRPISLSQSLFPSLSPLWCYAAAPPPCRPPPPVPRQAPPPLHHRHPRRHLRGRQAPRRHPLLFLSFVVSSIPRRDPIGSLRCAPDSGSSPPRPGLRWTEGGQVLEIRPSEMDNGDVESGADVDELPPPQGPWGRTTGRSSRCRPWIPDLLPPPPLLLLLPPPPPPLCPCPAATRRSSSQVLSSAPGFPVSRAAIGRGEIIFIFFEFGDRCEHSFLLFLLSEIHSCTISVQLLSLGLGSSSNERDEDAIPILDELVELLPPLPEQELAHSRPDVEHVELPQTQKQPCLNLLDLLNLLFFEPVSEAHEDQQAEHGVPEVVDDPDDAARPGGRLFLLPAGEERRSAVARRRAATERATRMRNQRSICRRSDIECS
ncbi:hypothetical protein NL676_004338 [Syzygium grande]|nr:hypothetical protein NL676_004338 [Syzygium grande]